MAAKKPRTKRAKTSPSRKNVKPRVQKRGGRTRLLSSHPFNLIVGRISSLDQNSPKWFAVASAVAHQLQEDQKWPLDPNRTMAQSGYDQNTLRMFLEGVQAKLAAVGYTFTFDSNFVYVGLGLTIGPLTDAIDQKTV